MVSGRFSWGADLLHPELIQIMSARSGPAPVCLLDVVATDGTSYHWGNVEIDVTAIYTGTQPSWFAGLANPPANYDTHYFPWLLSASGFHHTRSMQSDTANIQVQNVSGNTLQRDLAGMLTARTFEGALFAFREWNLVAQAAEFEQHGRLTVISATEMECQFGANQLFNPNDYDGNPYAYSETCQWRFGSPQCGSTAANDSAFATPCDNTYVTCHQLNRFGGVLNTVVFPQTPGVANVSSNQVEYRRLV
jgi:phage-related protein